MKIARGDVFWVNVGNKRRPAAVVTRTTVIPLLADVVVVPATRTIRGIPAEVRLGKGDGMPDECVLLTDQITVVPKATLKTRITTLSPPRLDELCDALSYALACDL